jgi:hypothetical protein
MLEYAKKYEEKLRQMFRDTAFDPYYRFEQCLVYREDFELPKDTWNSHHFVSVLGDEILGLIEYSVKRMENAAHGLHLIHFGGENAPHGVEFARDALAAIRDIFDRFGFEKLNFTVIRGNPTEKTYDRLVRRYGGRVVGIRLRETRLIDGNLYDMKEYEILRSEYLRIVEEGAWN